jgi:bifunctional DNase/RNase
LRELWAAQDARIYANAAAGYTNGHTNGQAPGAPQEIRLVDVLGDYPIVKTAVFWSKAGRRMLPVQVPAWDADALARQGPADPDAADSGHQPSVYRLAADVLAGSDVMVKDLEIMEVRDGVLRAVVRTDIGGVARAFDIRPVDAAGLAAVLAMPLCADENVVESAGIPAGQLYRSKSEVGAGLRAARAASDRSGSPLARLGATFRRS